MSTRIIRGPISWWRDPWRKPRVLVAITVFYLLWSLLPVLIAVAFSFNAGRSRTNWQGFSFRWYWTDQTRSVWHDANLHTALLQTLKLGVITTVICVPLGVLFAISVITFAIFNVIPNGDPAVRLAGKSPTPDTRRQKAKSVYEAVQFGVEEFVVGFTMQVQ